MDNLIPDHDEFSAKVLAELNEILVVQIQELDKTTTKGSAIELDILTISCLQLIVERESEIDAFPDAPIKRYTRESFIKELTDIGIQMDDDVMAVLQILVMNEYIEMIDGVYVPHQNTFETVQYLDKLFPGMPGMNLVAYFLQVYQEIILGIREYQDAKKQFKKTLLSRSKGEYKKHYKSEGEDTKSFRDSVLAMKKKQKARVEKELQAAAALKKSYVEKLSELRTKTGADDTKPSIVTTSTYAAEHVKIKEVFIKGSEDEPVSEPEEAIDDSGTEKQAEIEAREAEILQREKELEELESRLASLEEALKESSAKAAQEEEFVEEAQAEIEAEEADEFEEVEEVEEEEPVISIEDQIAAFEREQLAMPCPMCGDGKVLPSETESGKNYYSCTNSSCNFISWDKPYNFECPTCKTSYLVEFQTEEGAAGLKCPRANCTYSQNNTNAPAGSTNGGAPKKKRLVRKKRVRRKK